MRLYAGVGARYGVPDSVLERAEKIASELRDAGWMLRSGGAVGMDTAWAFGANGQAEIFRAEDCTQAAYTLASTLHPKWIHLSHKIRLLHGRNCMIVLGRDLVTPVERVLCWTPDGTPSGGTGMAIRVAEEFGISVTNLYHEADPQGSLPFVAPPPTLQ